MDARYFRIEDFLYNDLSLLLLIFSTTLLGAFAKDFFRDRKEKSDSPLVTVYISALVVSILIFSASEYIMRYFPGKAFFAICILGGLVSLELTKKLSTLDGIKKFIIDYLDFIKKRKK